jgi:hypothetical protein
MTQFPKYFELLLCSKKASARAEAEGQAQAAKAPHRSPKKLCTFATKQANGSVLLLSVPISLSLSSPKSTTPRLSQVISHPVPV